MTFITRFAPSPTGPLHLGHAYSALLAFDRARRANGTFLLRIEDIDQTRARPEWEQQIYDDLIWLGITWDAAPVRQSEHVKLYEECLVTLWEKGFLYPCSCTRRDIVAAANAPQEGTELVYGPDGLIYPGTCRPNDGPVNPVMPKGQVLRLNMRRALDALSEQEPFSFYEDGAPREDMPGRVRFTSEELITAVGDIVLSRKDFPGSYHLSVVLDDAAQGITHVIRGEDLFDATKIHVFLQRLLGLPTPKYTHHQLIRDERGKRLAKRCDARAIATYRSEGASPEDIRAMVGL
ncbi:tRNA glutamyl-Q(34) synthetase GluQRS [Pacificoceanicola onchidii]|uniref:tRNA glutamyl-Q(34) synthetase GluQRS n=1 Tax=Pacificoceanicola onchidii TaxID=2562685 RepID=UPI0010A5D05F|nr:tRNA glutamyl-Q(34) synthetase GluQRS [Pacificoceanicola onchidii]